MARAVSKARSAKTKAKKKTSKAKRPVALPRPRPFQLCVDFAPFPDKTMLGPSFTLAGFVFTQAGPPDMWVHLTGGEKGLQFPDAGMRIKLPARVSSISMRVGCFAGPFNVYAYDSGGTSLATRTVNFPNAYGNVAISTVNPNIAVLDFKGGRNEGMLVKLCIGLRIAD